MSGRIYIHWSNYVVRYELELDGDFEGASVEQRVKIVDSLARQS